MSVLIKGMEMPKSCIGCQFGSIESCDETEPLKIRCTIHGDFAHEVDWHEVCPLVEVPTPHGRLIDADALENEAQMRLLECNKYDNQFQKPYEVMRAIALAPTIIESEHETN